MGRIILGVIVGFIVWLFFLLGSDFIWIAMSPDWYGKHQTALEAAVKNKTPFMADSTILIIVLIRNIIFSMIAGFVAALIAKENFKSTLGLGILLLAFGIFIHSMFWSNAPLWYHFLNLLVVIPMTILGGKIRTLSSRQA
ncbi:MAG: hypothetical protein ABJA66_15225 [Actinomycetota bacterium]